MTRSAAIAWPSARPRLASPEVPAPIQIEALVDQTERQGLIAAAEQLNEALTAASGEAWPIQLRFHATLEPASLASLAVVVVSLLPALAQIDEPWPSVEARWRSLATSLMESGVSMVFLCTIFRRTTDRATRARLVERIRRLNLLAIDLSHDLGLTVVDIDRVFAHIGGRTLQCDFRPTGPIAAEVAGYVVARAFLSAGLDEAVPPDVQERAKAFLGELLDVNTLVNRRLGRAK